MSDGFSTGSRKSPYSLKFWRVKVFEDLSSLERFTLKKFSLSKMSLKMYFQSMIQSYDTGSN